MSLAFSPEGDTLFSSDLARALKVWEWPKGELRGGLEETSPSVQAVAFSPDTQLYGWATSDGRIDVFNRINGATVATFNSTSGNPDTLAFRPDNLILAAGSFSTVTFWNLRTLQAEGTLDVAPRVVTSLAFSPDGKTLAIGLNHGIVKLIDPQSKQELMVLQNRSWWQNLLPEN